MKHFNYCNELTWKENWNNWCAFNLEELKTFDETIQFSYEEKGVANVCTMNAEEVQRWILSLEYYNQDPTWPSRKWNSDYSDYIDLSGVK